MLETIWILEGIKSRVLCLVPVLTEYRHMAHTACEMMWLKYLLWELGFSVDGLMPFHDAVSKKLISILFTPSSKELTNMFIKHVHPRVFLNLC